MSDDGSAHDTFEESTDDLSLSRRDSLAALAGFGGLGATGTAGASSSRFANHGDPTEEVRPWNQHVDAQNHDLRNLHSIDVGHVYTSARDADALVWQDDEGTYHADTAEETVYTGDDFTDAVQAGIDSLSDGRTTKEKVVVACSGTMGPHEWDGDVEAIDIPSYTILDLHGTIYVEDEGEALVRPLRALNAEEIEIPRVHIEGNFRSAIWFRSVSNVKFGHVDIRTPEESVISGTGGGVRIDGFANGRGDDTVRSTDIQIDSCYIEKTVGHAFETYAVDRIQVGQVIANNPNFAGVLLNDTTDATVGAVVGKDVDVGGGYATFRVANGCHDVTCDQVVANGGARGIFGVSACSEITVGEVNIRGTDAHGILIQDCQNFTIEGGVVRNNDNEAVRIDSRSSYDHPPAEGVSISNLRVFDDRDDPQQTWGILETGPHTKNNRIVNCDLRDAGTEGNLALFSEDTVVRDCVGAGVDAGSVTLTSGASPAARVEGVTELKESTLDVRAKPFEAPDASFAWESYFAWDNDAGAWDLIFEWKMDPGEDLTLDYIVDRPQANLGRESGRPPLTDLSPGTYRLTADFNSDSVVMSVDGDLQDGANVYNDTWGEASGQVWEATEVDDGVFRISAADDTSLVLEAEDGGTDTGTNLVLGEWNDEDYQKFEAVPRAPGLYTLEPIHADLAADVWGVDPDPGADIRHWNPTGNGNQLWDFQDPNA